MIGAKPVSYEGGPPENGIYAAEVYWGWKLLEFHNGDWWHLDRVARWMGGPIEQWVGPLPARIGNTPKRKPKPEFDL